MTTLERKRVVHRGTVITLELHSLTFADGHRGDYEIVTHPGAAAVVAIDTEGYVHLVQQERWAVGCALLEVPAGKRDDGEDLRQCALRELEEEVGQRADNLLSLGEVFTTPGFCDERIALYLAESLTATAQRLDAHEHLDVVRMPFADAVALAINGTIRDAKSVIALLRAQASRAARGL